MKRLSLALAQALGAGIVLSMAGIPSALAQEVAQAPQKIEKIEVTGSNIKRIAGEGALPVQVITRKDIERTGATSTEQLLQTVSVAVQGNTNTVAASGSGATSGGVSGASLRGLGSQRTLVLINGRRISSGGTATDSVTVDVNSIPLAAIERVEVLKDGASAIYGSDAIAGVINFILRRDYQGAEVSVEYGASPGSGSSGDTTRATGAFGVGDLGQDRYNFMLIGNYQKERALFGRDRDFAKSGVNVAAGNDTTSGNTFPANINAVDGSFGTRNPNAPNNCAPSISDPLNRPLTRCRFDPSPFVSLLPDTQRGSLFASGRFALTPDTELFAEASYTKSKQQFVIQPTPISDQFALPPNHPLFNVAPYNGFDTIILRSTSPFYPTAFVQGITGGTTPDLNIRFRSFLTGLRDLTDTSEVPRLVLGVKGTAVGWDYDGALLYTETKLTEHTNGGYPLLTKILPLLNSGQVNFFGPNTPAIESQAQATNFIGDTYVTKTSTESAAAKASKELVQLPAGPLAIAVGVEGRKEKFTLSPNAIIQTGDVSGYGGNFLPIDKSRNAEALFSELNIPIVKSLEGNVAVRYDNYQGTGSKTTPKVGLRWQPVEQVLVRASYGKGFRAPSLTELFQPQITGVTGPGLNDPLRCPTTTSPTDCVTQFPILLGGSTTLKPEESDNYTLGIVFEPTKNISFGFDAFKVKLKNTIIFGLDPASVLLDLGKFGSHVTRGAPTVNCPGCPGPIVQIDQTNLNLGETRLTGLDVDFRFRFPMGETGNITVGLNGTYFDTYEVQNLDGTFGSVLGSVSFITNGNGGIIPRWRHYLSLDWTQGPWNFGVAENFQDSYLDLPSTVSGNTREVGTYDTYDVHGSYTGIKNLNLTLGVRNIFDRAPPYTNAGGQNFFQAGYDPGYADPRTRFVYARVAYKFK